MSEELRKGIPKAIVVGKVKIIEEELEKLKKNLLDFIQKNKKTTNKNYDIK